jgi:hypothetical protein
MFYRIIIIHKMQNVIKLETLRWAVKKFPERWYCTEIVDIRQRLPIHLQSRTLARTHTSPLGMPLLEAWTEDLFWNLPVFGRPIRLDVLYGCESCPLEAHFRSREQPKVTRSEKCFSWGGIPAQLAMCARCIIAETTVPATYRAASFELHRATSAKLARRSDQ